MSFKIRPTGPFSPQIAGNTQDIFELSGTTDEHTSAIAVNQQLFLTGQNYNTNLLGGAGNSLDNIFNALALGGLIDPITPSRTITFNNTTSATPLDLYLTVGGGNPQPITGIALGMAVGGSHIYPISNTGYNWSGNFTAMPAGIPPPQYNAGPTIAEFGLNQVWSGAIPPLRDTFDISTVPAGIGSTLNNGPRSAVVAKSQAAKFSVQQSYNYNFGVSITPPTSVVLPQTVMVTCIDTNGDCAQSIGYPNDTALPKQQTTDATGNYIVDFIDPVVSL